MYMKPFLFLLLTAAVSLHVFAQNPSAPSSAPKGNATIQGVVQDSATRKAVPFATVALILPATRKPLNGTVCEEDGKFVLKGVTAGKYLLSVTFLGYKTLEISVPEVQEKATVNVGTLLIAQQVQVLKEVKVTAQREILEERVDRTVYNAELDNTAKGGDATDVLRRVPTLSVDLDGNVSLRGSQNITVLINNKPSTITAGSVADALRQIPADMIKSVEVITSPSAKYDAEGSAGIINIITKKNNLEGLTLNVDAGVGLRGSNLRLSGNYRKGKMGLSLSGGGRYRYNVKGDYHNNLITNGILNTQEAQTRSRELNGRYTLGWDYDIDKHNSLNASVQYGVRNAHNFQDHLLTKTYTNQVLTKAERRDVENISLSGTLDLSLNYTKTFEKAQKEFSLLSLYSYNDRPTDIYNTIYDTLNVDAISRRQKNNNNAYNQEMTFQADYQTPLGKTQLLEMGGKQILRKVSSKYTYYIANGADGTYLPLSDASLSNQFNYDQQVSAGYLSYTLSLPTGYSVKGGLRYEYTTIQATFQNEQKVKIPDYGVLVPSFNASKKLKNGNTLKIAYNRRIQRPSLQFLNPNIQVNNSRQITVGNPNLNPEYTDNYELGYSTSIKKVNLSLTGFARNTTGSIQQIRDVLGDTIRTSYQNIGKEDTYGMSAFVGINISNKFTLNGGFDAFYAVLNNNVSNLLYKASNQGLVANYRLFGSYRINDQWQMQFFSFYRSRQVQLQGFQGGFGVYSLSIRREFKEKKGSIGLGFENFVFPYITVRSETNSPILSQTGSNRSYLSSVRIDFSYRIGKMSFDGGGRRKKSVNNDDLKEGENGGGDGGQGEGTGQQRQPQSGRRQGNGQDSPGAFTPGGNPPAGKPEQGRPQQGDKPQPGEKIQPRQKPQPGGKPQNEPKQKQEGPQNQEKPKENLPGEKKQ
jgi:outer membrane receptor protein involved in Fe transport